MLLHSSIEPRCTFTVVLSPDPPSTLQGGGSGNETTFTDASLNKGWSGSRADQVQVASHLGFSLKVFWTLVIRMQYVCHSTAQNHHQTISHTSRKLKCSYFNHKWSTSHTNPYHKVQWCEWWVLQPDQDIWLSSDQWWYPSTWDKCSCVSATVSGRSCTPHLARIPTPRWQLKIVLKHS